MANRTVTPPEVRFWAKVDKNGPLPEHNEDLGPCWQWTAGLTKQRYGGFHPKKGTTVLAHRYAYEILVGPPPEGKSGQTLDHLCRNRQCVNPKHLELVSNMENLSRGAGYAIRNGMRSGCKHGHEYTPENTYIPPDGGSIRCRKCARNRDRGRVRPSKRARSK
ncbi:HNH endonuclease [Gordonia phage Yvonnetastic]|uniref:HNH endonuclease n=1 Tax=Gordonia phage Yvonnetastic TaxID=1821566 RepID=A0A142K992_9CAUD|nr:HNH endonuclease [Gordonia phage Yvonnetastic]AMS02675.1 HNH endonuclease [Gordonia phage Yvonnetastic]